MRRLHVGESYLPEICEILCTSCLEKWELTKNLRVLERIIQSTEVQLLKLGIPHEWLAEEWWKYDPDWDA
ncbi:MAG: hypothetical protein OEZ48_15980 [Candidatus Bathyarchaeota archaeon]|nr:hypothetical protein [Candidatus Bathyarchaeota archaeon]